MDQSVRLGTGAGRLPSVRSATFALGGFTLLLVAAGAVLTVLAQDLPVSFDGVLLLIVVVVGAVGFVVARRQPSNPIGWLLLVASGFFALYAVAVLYAVVDFHQHGGRLLLGRLGLAAEPSWIPGFVLVGLAVALFPDGRIPPGKWRLLIYAYVGLGIWFATIWSLSLATLHIGSGFDVDGVGVPVGSQNGFTRWGAETAWLSSPLIVVLLIAFVVRQATVWRRAIGERRKQLTWLMCGGAVSVVSIVVVSETNGSGGDHLITDIAALGLTAVPLAIGVGILKYRLYEIDRLISRTVSYLILTGLLIGVFIGTVVVATDVLPFSSPVAVAASTLAAAALFNPVRKRIQHVVDHRFNRARYDSEAIVAAFTTSLREAVDLETVRSDLLGAVGSAVQPAHASLWIRPATKRTDG
jgi:hypothetical protein